MGVLNDYSRFDTEVESVTGSGSVSVLDPVSDLGSDPDLDLEAGRIEGRIARIAGVPILMNPYNRKLEFDLYSIWQDEWLKADKELRHG